MKKKLLFILMLSVTLTLGCGTAKENELTTTETPPEVTTTPAATTTPAETTTLPPETTTPVETTTLPPETTTPVETTTLPPATTTPAETTTLPPETTTPVETTPEETTTVVTYTYKEVSQVMYAKSSVNVRDLPSTNGNKLGSLAKGEAIEVTAVCNETGWYRFTYKDSTAYVSGKYVLTTPPVEETTPAETTTALEIPSEFPTNPETTTQATNNYDRFFENGKIVFDIKDDYKIFVPTWKDYKEFASLDGIEAYIDFRPEIYVANFDKTLPEFYCGTARYYSDTTLEEVEKIIDRMVELAELKMKANHPEYDGYKWSVAHIYTEELKNIFNNKSSGKVETLMSIIVLKTNSYRPENVVFQKQLYVTLDLEFVK